MSDFAGDWITTFGHMSLSQDGSKVRGVYHMGPNECTLEGTIQQGVLHFRYREPAVGGEGWFVLQRPGKFAGQWRQDGTSTGKSWQGERGFEGIWKSSFGPLRLVQVRMECTAFMKGWANRPSREAGGKSPGVSLPEPGPG